MQIAGAVVRSLRAPTPNPVVPPTNGLAWREQIVREQKTVTLDDILNDLWTRGIPVVPLDVMPAPSFQGAACVVEGRPVILLGHKHDVPGRVGLLVAHEAGHIAASDCVPNQPVFDEEVEILDDTEIERNADQYAHHVIAGTDSFLLKDSGNFKQLANEASQLERTSGVDASFILFAWAARTGNYPKASMAVKALYRGTGARRQLREHFDRHVDFEAASESDRALLQCVLG